MKRWIAIGALLLGPFSLVSQANAQGFPTPVPYMLPNVVVPTSPPFVFPTTQPTVVPTPVPVYSEIERPRDGVVCSYVPPQYLGDGTVVVIRYACEDGSILTTVGSANSDVLMIETLNDAGSFIPIGLTTVIQRP